MNTSIFHYANDQRVYLRCNPSQYGRIGTVSASGAIYDARERVQPVFWEHKDADIVSIERIDNLVSEEEYHERRRLFFALMRRPEMRVLRLALRDLRDDKGIDWRALTVLEIMECNDRLHHWILVTDRYMSVCQRCADTRLDFTVVRLHVANDPACSCEFCQ